MFPDVGSGAVGHKVVKEHPSAELEFGGAPVSMEMASRKEPAVEWDHVSVNHVASTIGGRMVESESKLVCFGGEFMHGIESGTSQGLVGPLFEISHQAKESLAVGGVIDVPNLLLNVAETGLETPLGPVSDLEKGV